MTDAEFLATVIKRNNGPDGKPKDPNLLRRMQNPICQACQLNYKKKFPDSPFEVECKGIAGETDFKEMAKKTGLTYEQAREVMDRQFWTEKHMKITNDQGEIVPFKARDYQVPVMQCTAKRKVSRMGRGMGKTVLGIFEELHIAIHNKNYPILVVAPAKSQAKKWYDDILWYANQDPDMAESLVIKQQQPFYYIKFSNGSTISIFTAGSTSGHGAGAIRSQDPRRTRLEEQDGLNEDDYKVLQPIFRRYENSEVHGAGTPTGARSMFWAMCKQFHDHKEFHVPITYHPDWGPEKEATCRNEARTEVNFVHEFLAEFGDQEAGVFKAHFVDACRRPYFYGDIKPAWESDLTIQPKVYFMGVDWNGEGTGTRIRVLEYNPSDHVRKVVASKTVAGEKVTTWDTLYAIRDLNRKWRCEEIYLDYGYGAFQAGMLRDLGKKAEHTQDRKLASVRIIDFGASLKTNHIIPKRGRPKYLKLDEEKRMTKPFMVEGAVMCLERGLFRFAENDEILDLQLRAYRVKTWSQHGYANTYTSGKEGDHDLDAVMLALLGIELKYGLLSETERVGRPAIRSIPLVAQGDAPVRSRADQVTSRQPTPDKAYGRSTAPRILYASRSSFFISPGRTSNYASRGQVPSRAIRFVRSMPMADPGRKMTGRPRSFPARGF